MQSADAWSEWLDAQPPDSPGTWLAIAKKGNPAPSVTKPEAIEMALCHGWIDGRLGRLDDLWFLTKFTPRRARSIWSKINCATVERLEAEGRMLPAGLAQVASAKADGRWDAAYAGSRTATPDPDLQAALDAEPTVLQAFLALKAADRYAVIWRVGQARRPETKARRIAEFVDLLREGRPVRPVIGPPSP